MSSFPQSSLLDAFNRESIGTSWTTPANLQPYDVIDPLTIYSDKVKAECSLASPQHCADGLWNTTFVADQEVWLQATVQDGPPFPSYPSWILYARVTTPGTTTTDGYSAETFRATSPSGKWYGYLYRIDNGVSTLLGSAWETTSPIYKTLGFSVIGSRLAWLVDGVEEASRTDSAYNSPGKIGLRFSGTGWVVGDNFGGGVPYNQPTSYSNILGIRSPARYT